MLEHRGQDTKPQMEMYPKPKIILSYISVCVNFLYTKGDVFFMTKQKRSIGHVKKLEGDKYLLRLSLGYDDFGKRIQPSKVVHCSSDREAERMLMDFARERERFANTPTVKIPDTLEKLYAEWTENHVKINLAPKTAEYYGYLWNGHLKPYSKLKIKHATAKNIYQILSSICTDKTKNAVF